jgi:hypothetical protein
MAWVEEEGGVRETKTGRVMVTEYLEYDEADRVVEVDGVAGAQLIQIEIQEEEGSTYTLCALQGVEEFHNVDFVHDFYAFVADGFCYPVAHCGVYWCWYHWYHEDDYGDDSCFLKLGRICPFRVLSLQVS